MADHCHGSNQEVWMCKVPKLMKPEIICARYYWLGWQDRWYIAVSAPMPSIIARFQNVKLVDFVNRLQTKAYTNNQPVASVLFAYRTWSQRSRIRRCSTPHIRPATYARQKADESFCTLHDMQVQLPRRRYWYLYMLSLIFTLRTSVKPTLSTSRPGISEGQDSGDTQTEYNRYKMQCQAWKIV